MKAKFHDMHMTKFLKVIPVQAIIWKNKTTKDRESRETIKTLELK